MASCAFLMGVRAQHANCDEKGKRECQTGQPIFARPFVHEDPIDILISTGSFMFVLFLSYFWHHGRSGWN